MQVHFKNLFISAVDFHGLINGKNVYDIVIYCVAMEDGAVGYSLSQQLRSSLHSVQESLAALAFDDCDVDQIFVIVPTSDGSIKYRTIAASWESILVGLGDSLITNPTF